MYVCCWSSCAFRSRATARVRPYNTRRAVVLYGRTLAVALVLLCSIQHLPGVRHQQNALVFSMCPLLRVNLAIIAIAEIDAQAAFFRDTCCQRNLNTWRFHAAGCLIAAYSFNVRAMRQD